MEKNDKSEEMHLEFVQLMARHERVIRGFTRSLLPSGDAVDDIMQEVFVVAWKKFDQLRDPVDFTKWVCGIARYQVLNHRRSMARSRLLFSPDVINQIADEAQEETDDLAQRLSALEACIDQLPDESKTIVQRVYKNREAVANLAKEAGKRENAIYQKLWRIRQTLSKCVEAKIIPIPCSDTLGNNR